MLLRNKMSTTVNLLVQMTVDDWALFKTEWFELEDIIWTIGQLWAENKKSTFVQGSAFYRDFQLFSKATLFHHGVKLFYGQQLEPYRDLKSVMYRTNEPTTCFVDLDYHFHPMEQCTSYCFAAAQLQRFDKETSNTISSFVQMNRQYKIFSGRHRYALPHRAAQSNYTSSMVFYKQSVLSDNSQQKKRPSREIMDFITMLPRHECRSSYITKQAKLYGHFHPSVKRQNTQLVREKKLQRIRLNVEQRSLFYRASNYMAMINLH